VVVPVPDKTVSRVHLFGKLPAHGDFVVRGMGTAERDALDTWLSQGIAETRERMGPTFEDCYDRAPPWRFAGPGASGVLVPSMDAAGRRYPLYLALKNAPAEAAGMCEELVYTGFARGWNADRFMAEAAALVVPVVGEAVATPRWWTLGGEGFAPANCAGERPSALFTAVLTSEEDA
jgi:type VI secretion system protein ImpM